MNEKEITKELEGKILKEFREGYQKRSREEDERFLLLAIASAVEARERAISEAVKKCTIWYGSKERIIPLLSKSDVLSIIHPSKE